MERALRAPPRQGTRGRRRIVDNRLRHLLLGRPRATQELEGTLLPKTLALPIFSSDALSSVAYATESALVVLVAVSASAAGDVRWIAIAVAALLAIVALSYRQTIAAYQKGGGSYVVARENLGTLPGLVAAAALLVDYTLTVAVSVSAGIVAIVSVVPSLDDARVELALASVGALVLVNLRGVREAGLAFALPTYGFIAALMAMIGAGLAECVDGVCPQATTPDPLAAGAAGSIGLLVILRAFASGSSALTGVEAIANGVPAFRPPKAPNAAATLTIMATIAIVLFLGVSWLAVEMGTRPSGSTSILAQIARATFAEGSPASALYYVVQGFTLAILVLAANTSFQGFPRLAGILARDRFAPRQFGNLGDRLVYSNGILVLAGLAAVLIAAFKANVNSLIHLYVVGVFTAFTLSQTGMVIHWRRHRPPGWRRKAVLNGVGAAVTGLVAVIVVWTKFLEGAWAVIVAIPMLVAGGYAVHRRYRQLGRRLREDVEAVSRAPLSGTSVRVNPGSEPLPPSLAWLAETIAALPPGPSDLETVVLPRPHRSARQAVLRSGAVVAEAGAHERDGASRPDHAACRILVAGAHAAALRSVQYARTLSVPDTRALFFSLDPDEGRHVAREWQRRGFDCPLDVAPDTFRDLGDPLLQSVREITDDPAALAIVVIAELTLPRPERILLHSQHALYVRRLLLREPGAVVVAVPYRPQDQSARST